MWRNKGKWPWNTFEDQSKTVIIVIQSLRGVIVCFVVAIESITQELLIWGHTPWRKETNFLQKTLCINPTQTRFWFPLVKIRQHNTPKLHGHNLISSKFFLYEGLIQNSSRFTANLICLQTSWKQFQNRNVRFLGWATCLLGPGAARWGLFKIFLQRKIIHLPTSVCGCVSDVRLESVMIILARGEVVLSFA